MDISLFEQRYNLFLSKSRMLSCTSWMWLLAMGVSCVFGLQGSVSLALRYRLAHDYPGTAKCDRVVRSSYACFAGIPIAYSAVVFYLLVLLVLIQVGQGALPRVWLDGVVVVGLGVTCYYAFILFFRLRIVCAGCLRIYLANLMLGIALAGCHLG